MKVDIGFTCDSVEAERFDGRIGAQMYGVYKTDIIESALEIMSIEEIIEKIGFDKICDFLESRYDIETIKERR